MKEDIISAMCCQAPVSPIAILISGTPSCGLEVAIKMFICCVCPLQTALKMKAVQRLK